MAFKDAAAKAVPVLLEPIMSLEVVSPDDYLGDIVGDLNARRGKIEGMEMRVGSRVIKALAPLAEMFGYATILRTLTQGRGVFSMEFAAVRDHAARDHGGHHRPDRRSDRLRSEANRRTPWQRRSLSGRSRT